MARTIVITGASDAANTWGGDFSVDDLNNERAYKPERAYGNGKLANVLFTRELDRRHRSDGISAVAFHPGVVRSNFASETNHLMRFFYGSPLKYLGTISPERSSERLDWLVNGTPGTDWEPGGFYGNCKPLKLKFEDDGTVARELWDRSEQLLAG